MHGNHKNGAGMALNTRCCGTPWSEHNHCAPVDMVWSAAGVFGGPEAPTSAPDRLGSVPGEGNEEGGTTAEQYPPGGRSRLEDWRATCPLESQPLLKGQPEMSIPDNTEESNPTPTPPASPSKVRMVRGPRSNNLPLIITNGRYLHEMLSDAVKALYAGNTPPQLWVKPGGGLCEVVSSDTQPRVRRLGVPELRLHLARTARYALAGREEGKYVPIIPPDKIAESVLAKSDISLPELRGISSVPLIDDEGNIISGKRYDAHSKIFVATPDDFESLTVPDKPSVDDVKEAVAIIEDLIEAFPFENPASRANFYALLLTNAARHNFTGVSPLAIIAAHEAGTGKSLLSTLVGIAITGGIVASTTHPENEAEMRKTLITMLDCNIPLINFDNLDDELNSANLASMLTKESGAQRVLGSNNMITIINHSVWVATGNNVTVGGDLARRCYWINLDAQTFRPYTRTGFKHPNLIDYALSTRVNLIRSLLILVKRWINRGKPRPDGFILGGFEDWCRVMRGILESAGIRGFLENQEERIQEGDEGASELFTFVYAIAEWAPDNEWGTGELASAIVGDVAGWQDALPLELARKVGRDGFSRSLGRWLAKNARKRVNTEGLRIEPHGMENNVRVWYCAKDK